MLISDSVKRISMNFVTPILKDLFSVQSGCKKSYVVMAGQGGGRLHYIEFLRVVACFFVIFNHTSIKGFFLFATADPGSLKFWLYLFISVFCKLSVPLFFAISGTLMLS